MPVPSWGGLVFSTSATQSGNDTRRGLKLYNFSVLALHHVIAYHQQILSFSFPGETDGLWLQMGQMQIQGCVVLVLSWCCLGVVLVLSWCCLGVVLVFKSQRVDLPTRCLFLAGVENSNPRPPKRVKKRTPSPPFLAPPKKPATLMFHCFRNNPRLEHCSEARR
jgi:hypothetical protein